MAGHDQGEMRRAFLKWCEKERADAAHLLERFKSGAMTTGTEGPGGYVDGSADMIDTLRRVVDQMDALIPKVRSDLGDFIDGGNESG